MGCSVTEKVIHTKATNVGNFLLTAHRQNTPAPSLVLAAVATIALLSGCKHAVSDVPIGPTNAIHAPLGLPPVPIPADNPPTADTIALGRKLFYDNRLSGDNTVSCANCHNPAKYFTDGQPVSVGVHGQLGTRHAPTVL